MSQNPLAEAVWAALSTTHRHLADTYGSARRYPAAVAPFAALQNSSADAFLDLRHLLLPGESVFLQELRPPSIPGLLWAETIPCLEMVLPFAPFPERTANLPADRFTPQPSPTLPIKSLDCRHAPEMMALIAVAYPGYFRPETCRMGRYFGMHATDGSLIAMGGERLCFQLPGQPPWREISALCTHPAHAGRGLGTAILAHILALHRGEGSQSWLWVVETNRRAIDLYLRFGFEIRGRGELQRVGRA